MFYGFISESIHLIIFGCMIFFQWEVIVGKIDYGADGNEAIGDIKGWEVEVSIMQIDEIKYRTANDTVNYVTQRATNDHAKCDSVDVVCAFSKQPDQHQRNDAIQDQESKIAILKIITHETKASSVIPGIHNVKELVDLDIVAALIF